MGKKYTQNAKTYAFHHRFFKIYQKIAKISSKTDKNLSNAKEKRAFCARFEKCRNQYFLIVYASFAALIASTIGGVMSENDTSSTAKFTPNQASTYSTVTTVF